MSAEGKTIVITGASSGLGRAAARELARLGATLAVVGRNRERTEAIAAETGGTAFFADFDRLDDVRKLAADLTRRYPRIDVLANNAGGLVSTRGLSADGYERTLQHNHLAPFLLTSLLLDRLEASGGRVISTASVGNLLGRVRLDDLEWAKRPYLGGWQAYGTSKLETILFIDELARRHPSLTAFSFHPGYVATEFGANSPLVRFGNWVSRGSLGISPEQGGAPLVHLAGIEDLPAPSGTYFDGLKPFGRTAKAAKDQRLASDLWDATAGLVGR